MPTLRIQSGALDGQVIALAEEIITVGSAPGNKLQLKEEGVSAFHATLVEDEGDYLLTDQQSETGTFVNGKRITEQKLGHGDQVCVGAVLARYESEVQPPPIPVPPPIPAGEETGKRSTRTAVSLAVVALLVIAGVGFHFMRRAGAPAPPSGSVPAEDSRRESGIPSTVAPAPAADAVPLAAKATPPSSPSRPASPPANDIRWAVLLRDSALLSSEGQIGTMKFAESMRTVFAIGDEDPLVIFTPTLGTSRTVNADELAALVGGPDQVRPSVTEPGGNRAFDRRTYGKVELLVDPQTGAVAGLAAPLNWWAEGLRTKAERALPALGAANPAPPPAAMPRVSSTAPTPSSPQTPRPSNSGSSIDIRGIGRPLNLPTGRPPIMAFSSDGKTLVGAVNDQTIRIFDVTTGTETKQFPHPLATVRALAISPNGRYLAIGSSTEIQFWDAEKGVLLRTGERLSSSIYSFAFSPDSQFLAVAHAKASTILSVATGRVERVLNQEDFSRTIDYSPDGNFLACTNSKSTKIWRVNSGSLLHTLLTDERSQSQTSIAYARDGKSVAVARAREMKLFDANNGAVIWSAEANQTIYATTFSPDGSLLGAGGFSNVTLFESSSGRVVGRMARAGTSIAFSPDGRTLLSSGRGELNAGTPLPVSTVATPPATPPIPPALPPPTAPATPPVDLNNVNLTQLAGNRAEWPATVKLNRGYDFPVYVGGRPSGTAVVPIGQVVKVVSVQPAGIEVDWNGSKKLIPASDTDLIDRVLQRRRQGR